MSDIASSVSMPHVRRRVIGSNVWLLSFGDLVTLLLGFFVAIIAGAMQNPPKTPPANTAPGTSIAQTTVDVSQSGPKEFHQVLILAANNFEADSGAFVNANANILKTQLKLEKVTVGDVLIQGCDDGASAGSGQARFTQIGRLLATSGQLIDAGILPRQLRIETPSAVCERDNEPGSVKVSVTGSLNG